METTSEGKAALSYNDRVLKAVDGKDPIDWLYETFIDSNAIL